MEQNPTQTPTFTLLKITDYKGVVNYIPLNNANRTFHEEKKRALNKDKREKYLIEQVTLSVEEAAAIGWAEAHQVLHPPTRKGQQSNDLMAVLGEQNKMLMQMLAEKTETKTKK
jgi:hypothetical protein